MSRWVRAGLTSLPLLLSGLLLGTHSANAREVDSAEMRSACLGWLEARSARPGARDAALPSISEESPVLEDGRVLGVAFALSPAGFVIVPARTELPPVLAWSDEGTIDLRAPGGPGAILRGRLSRLTANLEGASSASGQCASAAASPGALPRPEHEWARLLDHGKSGRESLDHAPEVHVGPLLRERYHQGPPYNLLAPAGCFGERCLAGCTSIAAAQIARYHAWPLSGGSGQAEFSWNGDQCCAPPTPPMPLTADFRDAYAWSLMPDSCLGSCGEAADSAVAELVYELGVGLGTQYGICGSSSTLLWFPFVFPEYLDYAPLAEYVTRPSVGDAHSWFLMLREDLSALRPVAYGFTYTAGSPHDCVCDGWGIEADVEWIHLNLGQGDAGFWFRADDTGMSDPMSDSIVRHLEPPGRRFLVAPDISGDFPTIQAALSAVPAGAIVELADGIYRGPGKRDLDFHGKSITLRSRSGRPENCIIDCEGTPEAPHRAFVFREGEGPATVVQGLTLRGGCVASAGDGLGGAVRCVNGSRPVLMNCVFEGNRAGAGGAIGCADSSGPVVEQCVFRGNVAETGGAVAVVQPSPGGTGIRLEMCTFHGNSAPAGSALWLQAGSRARLRRTILAGGLGGEALAVAPAAAAHLSCCDLWGNEGGNWTPPILEQLGLEGNIEADPRFCDAAGGDLSLSFDSPCAGPECGRMGALPAVHCAENEFVVGAGQPYATLSAALAAAPAGARILLADTLYTGDGNRDLLVERDSLTIEPVQGLPACVIDLQGSALDRHQWLAVLGRATVIRGVTVRGGYSLTGGAISLLGWMSRLEGCAFEDCEVDDAAGGTGGAVYLGTADLVLTDCRFDRCHAGRGGALYQETGCGLHDTTLVRGCRFSGNTASEYGGAVFTLSQRGRILLEECILDRNEAPRGGALAAMSNGRLLVRNGTLVGNAATVEGAAAFSWAGAISMVRCVLAANTGRPAVECVGTATELDCSILWDNEPGTLEEECVADDLPELLLVDPLFCSAEDLHPQPGSPCLPGSPGNDGCGWIGALPGGCLDPGGAPAPSAGVPAPRLRCRSAQPAGGPVRLELEVPEDSGGRPLLLAIHDAAGRLVRVLRREPASPGPQAVTWDIRDDRGRTAPSGVYFARFSVGAERVGMRLVVVR